GRGGAAARVRPDPVRRWRPRGPAGAVRRTVADDLHRERPRADPDPGRRQRLALPDPADLQLLQSSDRAWPRVRAVPLRSRARVHGDGRADPADAAAPGLRAGPGRYRCRRGRRTRVIELLAADRQSVIILAFWTLVGAGIVVSVGAWVLLRRESRAQRTPETDAVEEPAGTSETS